MATPTAARTPLNPMPLQYESSALDASAWSKSAAVSKEALEVFDGMSCSYLTNIQPTPLLDVLLFGCYLVHYKVPWPPPDWTRYAYCQVQHWGLLQKIGIHLWDSGIALSYFAIHARRNHNVFESKGEVQQIFPGPPPICSSLAAHRLDTFSLPWPLDPCKMIVDSGIAAYSILALTDCHCTSEAGGGISRSFLIHTILSPLVQSTFFSGIFQPFRNSQLSVWVTLMVSMGQQVFDRGRYMEVILMQLLLQARADPNTPAVLRRLPMELVVMCKCKCKEEVKLRLSIQSHVLALLTFSWPPPAWSRSSVLGTIKPFLNLHEFWQQKHVRVQFTGLPSLGILELKPWPPPTSMRNELLQVERTSVYISYGLLAQNTINQTTMFVWRQEWCGIQNNCYYWEQILVWCLFLCTAKGRCWKVAGSWQCKSSNEMQVLPEISYCRVKYNSNPLPSTAYASALSIKHQEQLLQQYKLGRSQRLQRQQHGQQLDIKSAAMFADNDMPPVELLRKRCQLSKVDIAFGSQGGAGRDGNAPPIIAVLACVHAGYSKLYFYTLMIEDP